MIASVTTLTPPASAAPVAPAGTCTIGLFCGVIKNDESSNTTLQVTENWNRGPNRWLQIGQSSRDIGIKDADGFYVPGGCNALVFNFQASPSYNGPRWVQIHDWSNVRVRIRC